MNRITSENKSVKETEIHSEYQIGKKSKPKKIGIWIISAVEILGGSFGILVVVMLLLSGTGLSSLFLALAFFVFQVVAGVLLWKNNPFGLTLSRVAQIMQIPYLSISQIIHYNTMVGVSVFISIIPDGLVLGRSFGLGATFNLLLSASLPYSEIGVNIVALVILVYLIRYRSPQSSYQEE